MKFKNPLKKSTYTRSKEIVGDFLDMTVKTTGTMATAAEDNARKEEARLRATQARAAREQLERSQRIKSVLFGWITTKDNG